MRSNGQVRFVTITAQLQRRLASLAVAAVAALLLLFLGLLASQFWMAWDRQAVLAQKAEVENSEERIAAYRGNIDQVADELTERQNALDAMFERHFGGEEAVLQAAAENGDGQADDAAETNDLSQEVSSLVPEAAPLARLEARQIAFAERLTRAAIARSEKAAGAIRKFGLDPERLAANPVEDQSAMGGPFIPFIGGSDSKAKAALPEALVRLDRELQRMDRLERSLLTIPSARPARLAAMSSSYGYRRDPFTGARALHSGIDFKGAHGTPILAAASGRVVHAGYKGGYGKTVEIRHAGGLMTRYAHLSRITVRPGAKVQQGQQLGGMGSTGRSTGTHLHFEVRLNGRAINPRPFLEAQNDVLKIQAVARRRTAGRNGTADGNTNG